MGTSLTLDRVPSCTDTTPSRVTLPARLTRNRLLPTATIMPPMAEEASAVAATTRAPPYRAWAWASYVGTGLQRDANNKDE